MRHPNPFAVAALSAPAFLAACSTQPAARQAADHTRHLTGAEVTRLFATEDGRETLRALDADDPRILYDGRDRFVQINTTISPTFGGRIPSLTMHSGWMHPDYAVERPLLLAGAQHDQIHLAFTDDALQVTIHSPGADPDAEPHRYTISWPQGETPQAGWIDLESGQLSLLPHR